MAARGARSTGQRIRRESVRLHSGPWTVYVGRGLQEEARAIVSLGRTAGPAVARSRIRRIARSVFGESRAPHLDVPLLLTARASVATTPRRRLRADFGKLKDRVVQALTHPPKQS
jgi:ribonuclease P protein component